MDDISSDALWLEEAKAVLHDVKQFVEYIRISEKPESSNSVIFFDIKTLEGKMITMMMSQSGFAICDNDARSTQNDQNSECKTFYETVNALLDTVSPLYRQAFADALARKIHSLE